MPISAPNVIEPAFRHAKEQLMRPFRFGQWWRLALVGLLAGEMGSTGSFNFNYPANSSHHGSHDFLGAIFTQQPTADTFLSGAFITFLVLVGIALAVLFTYVSSVMRFILFDSIVTRNCRIREGWRVRKDIGFRLFLWRLVFALAILAVLAIVIGGPIAYAYAMGWFAHTDDHMLGLILGGVTLFLMVVVVLVLVAIVEVMTKDFVVPQMALEYVPVMEGWRRLWSQIKSEKAGYAGYIGMKIALAIGASIAVVIITILAIVVPLLIFGGVGAAAVFGGAAAGLTWNVLTIALAVVYGAIALVVLIFIAALISVPVVVFFPAYSIYFFAPRYPPLAALLWPPPSAPTVVSQTPPEPAPL